MPTDLENKSNSKLPSADPTKRPPEPASSQPEQPEADETTKPSAAAETADTWRPVEMHPRNQPQTSQPTRRVEIPPGEPHITPQPKPAPESPATHPDTPAQPPLSEPTRRITYAEEPKPTTPPATPQHPPAEPTRRIYVQPAAPTQRIPVKPRPPQRTQHIERPPTEPASQTPPSSSPSGETHRVQTRRPEEGAESPAAYPHVAPSRGWEPTQAISPAEMPVRQPRAPDRRASANVPRRKPPANVPPRKPPQTPPAPPQSAAEPEPKPRLHWPTTLLTIALSVVGLFFVGTIISIIAYIAIAAQLPSPDELRQREPKFASSQIYDRDGTLLHEIIDPSAGKRTYIPLNQTSDYLKWATIATEDRTFYSHAGVEPIAVIRALYYALQERRIVSGFSSITQQVARNILLPDEASERSASRKIKEVILATELERRYSKDVILEIYINNNNYGNMAYGIDAAARTYFGTSAANLTLAQATFLAGIPQLPSVYDPFHGGRDAALKRHKAVLALTVEAGYITQEEADAAALEMEQYEFAPIFTDRIPAPHFVTYVKQWVEAHPDLGSDRLYTGSGLRIHTTLDWDMQRIAEEEVANGVANLASLNVTNGALIAIEPASGHILAMVGSADFYNEEIGGQVNLALRCRQPGSAIKPLTYLSAFEKGWTPATVVWDVPTVYTDAWGNTYEPVNYDGKFRGPTSVRTALANSLNIPAVKALEFITVDELLHMSERLGATSIVSPQLECPDYPGDTRPYYGLALTLGGGELKPLELTSAYATFANNGMFMEPTPIQWVEDSEGNVLVDYRKPEGEQVVKPELAYLLTNILSDTQARCLVFSCPNNLQLSDRPVAAKTGTTNDNRDAWTVGYTPDIAVGVWVGNNDNSTMVNVGGSSGAGPIWNAFMSRAHADIPPHSFARPAGVVEREICTLSGAEPSEACPERRIEVFSEDNLPLEAAGDWLRKIEIDANSNLRANEHCNSNVVIKLMLDLNPVTDPGGRKWMLAWAAQNGYEIAPEDYCTDDTTAPQVLISEPESDTEIHGTVDIYGTVEFPDFDHYEITYGIGEDPQGWGWISGPHPAQVRDGQLGTWQIPQDWPPGVYTLRVVAYNQKGAQFDARVRVTIVGPTATPTHTASPTPTVTNTAPPTVVTDTPTPSPSPSPSPSPTNTQEAPVTPTDTPAPATDAPPTDTPEPSPTFTPEAAGDTPQPTPTDTPETTIGEPQP